MPDETRISSAIRRLVQARAGGCCEYCRSQMRYATEPFVVEHILPRSVGGATILENLALACAGCNGHKATKVQGQDPLTGTIVPLFHPRRQIWIDHFRWSDDTTEAQGITPCGRATVAELKLNREPLVNLRRILHLAGEHPPSVD